MESSPQLFTVLCAAYAAGYDSDVAAKQVTPLRAQLRAELQARKGPAVEALRTFYHDHQLVDPGATLSRYISFALVAGPPPKFDFVVTREQLPPDVLALEGFSDVLTAFYREAEIERFWARVAPEYEREVRRLQRSVAQIVFVSAGYLREILKPNPEHTLIVYVEPLAGMRTNFRNYGGKFAVVLDPASEASLDEIRHSFLHFLLNPLPLRYRPPMEGRKQVLDAAARAPRMPVELREDFLALYTECLVKAVELRVRRLPADKVRAAVDEAEAEGYVLVRPISAALDRFEKSEISFTGFFPELIRSINLVAEGKRLETVQFAARQAGNAPAPEAPPAPPPPSELDLWLAEGEKQLNAQDRAAVATFERILEKYPGVPRAQYGLAVASVIQGNAERAKRLLRELIGTLSSGAPSEGDPKILSWSHVWLARIYEVEERPDLAAPEYRAALAVEGAPDSARLAAKRGLDKPPGSSRSPL